MGHCVSDFTIIVASIRLISICSDMQLMFYVHMVLEDQNFVYVIAKNMYKNNNNNEEK